MKWFYNLKIAAKLLISFIIVAILSGVVGYMGISNMGKINSMLNNIYDNNLVPITNVANANIQAIYNNRAVYDYIIETEKSGMDKIKENMDVNEVKMKQFLDKYRKTQLTEKEKQLLAKFDDSWVIYKNSVAKAVSLSYEGKNNEAMVLVNGEVTKTFQNSDDLLTELVTVNESLGKEAYTDSDNVFSESRNLMIVIIVICMLTGIGLAFFISFIISNPIRKIVIEAQKIAKGDLEVDLEVKTKDEVGELTQAFINMANNTNEVMSNIRNASEQVASGSKQVSDSSVALSQGATEQASSIEQLTASIEEISSQTRQNADNANQSNTIAEAAKSNAVQGNDQMKQMLKAMDEINDSSSKISKIIKVIDEIAFQTNILALNAAVEAARAGQHGKGFAVVAEEVRNLAARSANAAKETTDMIESSIKKVEGGTKIANETASALNSIVDGVAKVANLVGEIAVASNEQATGIAQINQGVMQVSQVVQTNSATSEESAAASEELSSQAEMLKEQVARFKLKKTNSSASYRGFEDISPDVLKMLEQMNNSKKTTHHNSSYVKSAADTSKKIALSDKEFGKY